MSGTDKKGGLYVAGLMVGALGVVFGDIGTSPLYALRECFHPTHGIKPTRENILGILSLIFWSLILIVSVKYVSFVLRADNKGEGGTLSLLSLAVPERRRKLPKKSQILILVGVFGAALLYGDGMITPAISVLSAVEGLKIVTPRFESYIIPITITIIVIIFLLQRGGTALVGKVFGPITLVWFITLAWLGISQLIKNPTALLALNPHYAVKFFIHEGFHAFEVLGAVILVVTGGEALYADMGHFGRRPIRLAWTILVFPALILNYLGQGSLLLSHPEYITNPFYRMAPGWLLLPLVALATAAAVIASQALISGAFSLTMQAIQLGYAPRLEIDHTSEHERGQIYLPWVNWMLMVCCIGLVLGFQTSSSLAAAYGIAVSLTMFITTILFYNAAIRLWKWNKNWMRLVVGFFLIIEGAFFASNTLKIPHGGWFPLLVAAAIFTIMSTWKTGRALLGEKLRGSSLPLHMFFSSLENSSITRVKGTAVFLSGSTDWTPMSLLHNLKHNKVLHERVVIMTFLTSDDPHVDPKNRVRIENLAHEFYQVIGTFGFMEDPSMPEIIKACRPLGMEFKEHETTYFLSRENIIPSSKRGMTPWREKLFAIMSRNSQRATTYFRLPPNRVVELGMQVEI
ncbi:MAG: potassium transporter Kup [Verrucomicrobiales bacterium]